MTTKDVKPAKQKEWEIQAYVSRKLWQVGIVHHGDQNASKRGPRAASIAKATGMRAGWPDMVILLPNRPIFVEFKAIGGKQSQSQKLVEKEITDLGFQYMLIVANNGEEAWNILKDHLT